MINCCIYDLILYVGFKGVAHVFYAIRKYG